MGEEPAPSLRQTPENRTAIAFDRVALFGSVVALAGCLAFAFVQVRPNRIAAGVSLNLLSAAGPVAAASLLALAAACAASSFVAPRARGRAELASGVALLSALLFALGFAARSHMPPGDSIVRVSLDAGAWLIGLGAVIVWFQGAKLAHSRTASGVAALVALAALAGALASGGLAQLSLAYEYRTQSPQYVWMLVGNHIAITLGGTFIAAVLGVPLGIAAARSRAVRATAIPFASVVQTVPSLALFGLLAIPLTALALPTIGTLPALIALTLYGLLPIVRNTYLGITGVDAAIVDAGRGMGMSGSELLWRVELPLALPLILDGLRVALVLTVGLAAVMAIGGVQDLGTLIFLGWGQVAPDLVLLGALPMVLLSILADRSMRSIERVAVSPGVRVSVGEETA